MLVHQPTAGQSMATALAQSPPVALNAGQRYYIEGLLKEGTGGDYLLVAFRECDANGTALAGTPADAVTSIATAGSFGGAPGNPDLVQITGTPPSDLSVTENDPVNLVLGPQSAVVRGRYELTLKSGERPSGLFTLIFLVAQDLPAELVTGHRSHGPPS